MQSRTAQQLTLLIFVIFSVWFSFYIIQPPEPKPASSNKTTFSAERAFSHVQQMSQQIHPLGTAANDSVRNYIIEELQKIGLTPTIQKGVATSYRFGGNLAAYTKNIIAKIDGQNPEHTILLMAHYDSTPTTLGAADDGSGVAAILETARALQSRDDSLKNNIRILITDGEERGLLGAELFVEQFAELDQIDLVLNLEARGSSGASMMFETSSPNSKLIPQFAEAAPDPVANSLMYTVYKLLPNDTDMSVTKRAGLNGFNFAFAEDFMNYHTMQDTPENLSLASLQHHGSNLLGNALHFGNSNFDLNSSSEYVYFNNATGGLVFYPSSWSLPIAVVAALLFVAYLIYLFRTGKLRIGKYLGSTILFLFTIAAAAAVTYFGWQGVKLLHPQYQWISYGEVYPHQWYFWGFSLLVLGLFSGVYGSSWIRKKLSVQQLLAGTYTIWMLLSLVTAWYLPTASYFFTWPALMGLIGWIILDQDITKSTWKSTGILALSLFAVLFLIPPYMYLIQVMLTTEMLAVSMILLALILGLAWPLVLHIIRPQKTIWISGLLFAGIVYMGIASVNSGFDAQHKKQNDINYVQNMDSGEAYWISRDHTSDSWTQQFLGENYQTGTPSDFDLLGNNLLYNKADFRDVARPSFELQADSSSDSLRYLSLQVDPKNKGLGMQFNWNPEVGIEAFRLDGKEIFNTFKGENEQVDGMTYFKDISDPTRIDFVIEKSAGYPELTFNFIQMGLPTHLISNYSERADFMMPKTRWTSNSSIWQTTVSLDSLGRTD